MSDPITLTIPTLETERLRLRAPQPKDLETWLEFRASDRTKFLGGVEDQYQAWESFAGLTGHWAIRGFGRWMVALKDTDKAVGIVGIYYPSDWPEPEIAWSLFEGADGKGYATEAALASRAYAYDVIGLKTLISCIIPDNAPSIALAQRLGATHEKDFDHPFIGRMQMWRHLSAEEVRT